MLWSLEYVLLIWCILRLVIYFMIYSNVLELYIYLFEEKLSYDVLLCYNFIGNFYEYCNIVDICKLL